MIQWIWTLLQKLWNWGMHDGLARRVPRNEGTQQKSGRTSKEGSDQPSIQLVTGSNARGLEEDEGDQGTRTSELSVKSGGVPKIDEGSGDLDYSMKEHFFSPLNPTNK
jgi:hypothetical protein